MNIPIQYIIFGVAILLLAGVIASKASSRLGVPALLLFLVVGMLAGTDGPGGIDFDYPALAQSLGIIALTFILFAGGLETRWQNIRPILGESIALATVGVAVTAGLTGWFAMQVLGWTLLESMLLGCVVSSTDAAAVFGVLRSRQVSIKDRLRYLLELESGSNDPMAVFLTVGMIGLLTQPSHSPAGMFLMFIRQMGLGCVFGYALGKAMNFAVNRLKLEYDGLYPVLTLAMALLSYGVTDLAGGNGFLAAYIAAIVLGNSEFIHKRSLIRFHDGLAWLMQIVMFVTLGLQVLPSQLPSVALSGIAISLLLMFVARPLGVFLTLFFSKLSFKEQVMISWVGLRGAAPIVLATFPLVAGIHNAGMIFNIVFFIVLTSALIQGSSIPAAARWLGLAKPESESPLEPLDLISSGDREMVEILVEPRSAVAGKRIVELTLPHHTLIILVARNGQFVIPSGGTALYGGDKLLVLAGKDQLANVRAALSQG